MPRQRKSPGQRRLARQQTVMRYNASVKGKARRKRYQIKQQVELIQAQAIEQQRLRDEARGFKILPGGTIQALDKPASTSTVKESRDDLPTIP